MDRKRAARIGRETVAIIEAGRYATGAGAIVELADAIERARADTVSYPPWAALPAPRSHAAGTTSYQVTNETSLEAAQRLIAGDLDPLVLNFASAKNPGGGFLSGSRAQEESLARSSALHACLHGDEMYAYHRARRDAMYTSWAIYSPAVPVFRNDEGLLLDAPYPSAFLTAAAVNAKVVLQRDPGCSEQIRRVMDERIRRILDIALAHDHKTLVLGAWGCGAFGNDTEMIASLFHDALSGDYREAFERIVLAILDWSAEERFIGPFRDRFAAA